MNPLPVDLAVVGHFSIDSLKLPSNLQPVSVMGGPVAYISLIVRRLGNSVAIFSKVGSDFPDDYLMQLSKEGVDISGILKTEEPTTSFELIYNTNLSSRALRLKRQGSAINIADLPCRFYAKAIHIAPIDCEINYEVVKHLRNWGGVLSIDPQGMTRRFNATGDVTYGVEMDKRLLGLVDIYKSAFDEITVLTGYSELSEAVAAVHKLGPKIVIVTMGSHGSVLSSQGKIYKIPAYSSEKAIDPTGAGDVFIGAFLAEFVHRDDLLWCTCVGSAAASLIVEGIGTALSGNKNQIYSRAEVIYKKMRR